MYYNVHLIKSEHFQIPAFLAPHTCLYSQSLISPGPPVTSGAKCRLCFGDLPMPIPHIFSGTALSHSSSYTRSWLLNKYLYLQHKHLYIMRSRKISRQWTIWELVCSYLIEPSFNYNLIIFLYLLPKFFDEDLSRIWLLKLQQIKFNRVIKVYLWS